MSASRPPPASASIHYTETVAINAVTEDLTGEVGFRLGRFSATQTATLWSRAHFGDQTFSVSETTTLAPGSGATRFDGHSVVYDETGEFELRMERTNSSGLPFVATAHVAARAQPTADPIPGGGLIPFLADLRFSAFHPPVQVRAQRMEVFGMVEARVRTDSGELSFSAPGKLHEQRGPRERFAPAFTYLSVVGDRAGLLAVDHDGGAYGFAWLDGAVTPVTWVRIDPPGEVRRFEVMLESGRRIDGVVESVRSSSDVVEGKRRPGATISAKTPLGILVGQLNDWRPDP